MEIRNRGRGNKMWKVILDLEIPGVESEVLGVIEECQGRSKPFCGGKSSVVTKYLSKLRWQLKPRCQSNPYCNQSRDFSKGRCVGPKCNLWVDMSVKAVISLKAEKSVEDVMLLKGVLSNGCDVKLNPWSQIRDVRMSGTWRSQSLLFSPS